MLKDKVAIITGGSRGIGAAVACRFADNGAHIALVYSGNKDAADSVSAEIISKGRRCMAYKCDVSDFAAVKDLVDAVLKDLGSIDILVNNAGIVRDGFVLTLSEKDYDDVLAVNLKGSFNLIKHVYRYMMKKRSGRIINISSVVGIRGNAGQTNYAASKAGIIGLTKSVAKELAGRGVTCNAIAPGYICTDMTENLSEDIRNAFISAIPMKRPGTAENVADAAVFLAGSMADYITGEVIKVDGGLSM